jgi:hypothetical protein
MSNPNSRTGREPHIHSFKDCSSVLIPLFPLRKSLAVPSMKLLVYSMPAVSYSDLESKKQNKMGQKEGREK